ncbi:MAG TPA: trigger factor [Coleofasciculaceae cyanobacterium]
MKVTQEKLPASQIGLEIEIPSEMSKQAYEKTLQEFTRSANIPGFRKGKVPRQVLIQRFGSTRLKAAVVEDLIQDGLRKALEQEKIEAIGTPELRSSFEELVAQFDPGSALSFSAAVDVAPEAKLSQYAGLQVKAEEVKYDPERVDKVLEDYRKRSSTLVPVEGRSAQSEDVATVDFAGRLVAEGEEEPTEIPGGSAEDFEIELVEGRFIPGFIDGILGMAIGETKEVAVTFPDPYAQEDLAGKPAVFTITLKELKERELPELDDDFAQEVSEFETLAELRASLEKRYQEEAEEKTKANKQEALLAELVKYLEVELPETLIKQEADFSVTQTAMRLSQQGLDIRKTFTNDIVSMLRQQARPEAIMRLQRTLALGEIAKQESIQVTPEEVDAKVAEVLEELAGQQDIDTDRLRQAVEDDLLRDKILGYVETQATVELVPEGSLKAEEAEQLGDNAEESLADNPDLETTVDVSAETIVEAPAAAPEPKTPEAAPQETPEEVTATAEAPAPAAEAPAPKGKGKKQSS